MKNLGQMMKQAQEMQSKMAEMQAALDRPGGHRPVRRRHGHGHASTARATCKRVKIDPKLVDPNEVEVLEDLIVAAANDAKAKVDAQMQEQMAKLTGGLQLPPGFKLPF